MTTTQKIDIINLYNGAEKALFTALEKMDMYDDGTKNYLRASDDATRALATQKAIVNVLDAIGYDIITDDADGALDIVPK